MERCQIVPWNRMLGDGYAAGRSDLLVEDVGEYSA